MVDRIGFDARLIGTLGIGRYISGLLPPLVRLLPGRLTIITRRKDASFVRNLVGPGAALLLSDAHPYRLGEQTALLAALMRARFSLVHCPHYNFPLAYPGNLVITIHDLFSFDFPEIHSGLLPRFLNRLLIRGAVRRARRIITPSRATAAAVAARFPKSRDRLLTIPEAAAPQFQGTGDHASEARDQTRFGIRAPYFLYLGQWKAYKNLPVLIEAFTQVLRDFPGAQLVLAGHDPRHMEVPRAATALGGAIVLPGRLPEEAIPGLYRGAAALVLPSRAEGFGLPVVEALACGTPVVCSDLPVLREIAEGVAAFCDPADPATFAQAMLAALRAPDDDGRREARVSRARRFSWERAAQQTFEAYEVVLRSEAGVAGEENKDSQ